MSTDTDTGTRTDTDAGPNRADDEGREPGEQTSEQTGEQAAEVKTEEKKPRKKAPVTSDIDLDDINAAALAVPELIGAAAPTRERSDQQKAMDTVAARAYAKWIEADRPSVWQKMPVVTYFLTEEELPKYRYLIRRACNVVEAAKGSAGVRVRFGTEFTLSEKMAEKIGRPDDAGKTVLAWAAIDKRESDSEGKGEKKDTPEKPERRSRK